jgi:hypothetical protein
MFAVTQLLDPTPEVWKVGLTNAFGSLALANADGDCYSFARCLDPFRLAEATD